MRAAAGLDRLVAPDVDTPRLLSAAAPRVLVVGDALLDGWWYGATHRLCREAPAPVVEVERRDEAAGGAANAAVNAAQLGAAVRFFGVAGADPAGDRIRGLLARGAVDCEGLVQTAMRTTSKTRILADDQVVARVDDLPGPVPRSALAEVETRFLRAWDDADALIVCDYGLGTLDGPLRRTLLEAVGSRRHRDRGGPLVVLDAHDPSRWRDLRADLATPNAEEAGRMVPGGIGGIEDRATAVEAHRGELLEATGARCVVVTLDAEGTLALPGPDFSLGTAMPSGSPEGEAIATHRTWARPATEKQASGAGDTFVAALTVGMAARLPAPTALNLAQAAADLVVHHAGTAVCTLADLEAYLATLTSAVIDLDVLERRVQEYHAEGLSVVLTNGCFDVLHRGHTRCLEQARQLGDVLIVAVNDDSSTRRLKGPGRPINGAADRAAILAALSGVDHVVLFGDDTAVELIDRLRPDVYAKGGDYTPSMLAETPAVERVGGRVAILDYVPDRSTTGMVRRIRAQDDRVSRGPRPQGRR